MSNYTCNSITTSWSLVQPKTGFSPVLQLTFPLIFHCFTFYMLSSKKQRPNQEFITGRDSHINPTISISMSKNIYLKSSKTLKSYARLRFWWKRAVQTIKICICPYLAVTWSNNKWEDATMSSYESKIYCSVHG